MMRYEVRLNVTVNMEADNDEQAEELAENFILNIPSKGDIIINEAQASHSFAVEDEEDEEDDYEEFDSIENRMPGDVSKKFDNMGV